MACAALAFAGCGRRRHSPRPLPAHLRTRLAGARASSRPGPPRSPRPILRQALFEASSGVRAYVVPAAADPLVRITAALPLGRLHEAEGEAGAAALLTHLLTTRGAAGVTRVRSRCASLNWARR